MMKNKTVLLTILLAVICVCGVILFSINKFKPTNIASDLQINEFKTFSDFTTTRTDNNTNAVSESTTQYYDENGSVKFVMNTKTNFNAEIHDNMLISQCECTAEYNNQTVTSIFQNNAVFTNGVTTADSIDEYVKNCANDCIKYGEAHFFGME